jgi:hypothetical protein
MSTDGARTISIPVRKSGTNSSLLKATKACDPMPTL